MMHSGRSISFMRVYETERAPVINFSLTDKERNYVERCYPSGKKYFVISRRIANDVERHHIYFLEVLEIINSELDSFLESQPELKVVKDLS